MLFRSPSRPFGTYPAGRAHPALKRWAILVCPSGTGRSRLFPMGAITQILVALGEASALRFVAGPDENRRPKRNSMVKRMMFSGLLGLFWSSTTIPAEPSALAVFEPTTESSLPQGLTVLTTAEEVVYTSPWLKVSLSLRTPTMTFLSVDATGTSRHSRNLLKAPDRKSVV